MARVKGIGELDWAIRKESFYSDGLGPIHRERGCFYPGMISETGSWELWFRLVLDNGFTLARDTRETLQYHWDLRQGHHNYYEVCVIDRSEKVIHQEARVLVGSLFNLLTNNTKINLRFSTSRHIKFSAEPFYADEAKASVVFCLVEPNIPIYPDKYLHALARKLECWAKE